MYLLENSYSEIILKSQDSTKEAYLGPYQISTVGAFCKSS